jgi:hypothetical protein
VWSKSSIFTPLTSTGQELEHLRPQPRAPQCMMFHVSTSNVIETLLLRNLREVFGEGDPERRRSAIEELYTEDCIVNLPVDQYHGHDALDRICGDLRASHPSYVYTPHSAPSAVQNGGRVDWGSGPAGKPPRYTGIDVIITHDDKISALYVFLNSPPA